MSAPPPGFSGPPQPGYGPPQGFAPQQPGFPPPGSPGGPRKKGKGRLIAIIAAIVVVIVVVGVVAAAALGGKKSPTTSNNPGSASTTTGSHPGNTPGAATATPTTPPSSGGAPTGYTKYSGGLYTIDYPQDWVLDPSGQEEGTTSFTGPGLQVLEVDVENVGDENTAQYLSLYCQTLGDTNPGSPTTVTIGGQQWQKLVCNVNGQPGADAAAITYKGHIFTINTLSLGDTYATDVTQFFQPMEQSFAFTS